MDKPSSHRLRTGRQSVARESYLCTTKTDDNVPVFADWELGRMLVRCLRFSDETGWTSTWAFVVMPDHLHWLFELSGQRSLSQVIYSVKQRSAYQLNQRLGRSERVWQPGFHDHRIRDGSLLEKARYVVGNPIKAGLVDSVGDYPLWDAAWV